MEESDKKKYERNLSLKTFVALTRGYQSVNRKQTGTIISSGLTVPQFAVLEILYHKGDMKISEITRRILSTGGNMTVVAENLIKNGFVVKIRDSEDRRASRLSLTEKGRNLMDKIFPEHADNITKILGVLTEEEKKELIRIMLKLRDKL